MLLALWLGLTRNGRQTVLVTSVGLRTLGQRLGSVSVIVIGIAGVVGVLVALLAMGSGLSATLQGGGRDDTAIVLRGGSTSEAQSVLVRSDVDAITQEPGVQQDAKGKPLASAELVVAANVRKKGSDDDANAQLRDIDPMAWALRPDLKIIRGSKFHTGMRELVVGEGAAREFAHMDVGDTGRCCANQRWG